MNYRLGYLLLLLAFLAYGWHEGAKECRPRDCSGVDCPTSPCHHGDCDEAGDCVCQSCWSGLSCDAYDNKFKPTFTLKEYDQVIPPSTPSGVSIVKLHVTDFDAYDTCQSRDDCACASLEFIIVAGNDDSLFEVDQTTGSVVTNEGVYLHAGKHYQLEVAVGNRVPQDAHAYQDDDISLWSRAIVHVHVKEVTELETELNYLDEHGYDTNFYDEPHHRSKRAAVDPIPDNVTFTLTKTGDYENITEMRVGSKIHFKLVIHFPAGTTDMLVELFTPDNDTTVMVICGAAVTHVGTNLNVVAADVPVTMEAKDTTTKYDRAIMDFGNVTNDPTDTVNDYNSMIDVEWDAVMVDNAATVDGATYWVSAGAEYNNDYEVWVGQASFVTVIDNYEPPELPTFNMTGPDEIQIGSSAIYHVDMYLPYPSVDLAFDAFAPLNTTDEVMSVCSVVVVDAAVNYGCLQKDLLDDEVFARDSGKGNDRGRLNIGTVTNKGMREDVNPWENNRISIDFVLYVYDEEAYIGQNYWVGGALELGTDKIWAGQMSVSVVNKTEITSMVGSPTFTVTSLGPAEVMVDEFAKFEVTMTLPEGSEADYELEVLAPFNDSLARMKLCSVQMTFRGANIPCVKETEPDYLSRDLNGAEDRAVWNLGRIHNTGLTSVSRDPTANQVVFQVVGTVLNHTLNVDGEQLWTTVGMSYADQMWVGMISVDFADGTRQNATAPTFDLKYSQGQDHIPVGGSVEVIFEMKTDPGMVYAPLNMELMLPYENGSTVISVCRAELAYVGKNHPCVKQAEVNGSIAYVSKSNDGVHSKAVIDFGTMCNTRDSATPADDPDDDVIRFSFVVRVEDHENLENGTQKWVSVGVMYSETQLWVGQIALYSLKDTLDPPTETPHFELYVHNATTNDVPQGRTAIISSVIKLPPQSTTSVKLVAYTSSTSLSICTTYFKDSGYGMPCLGHAVLRGNATEQHAGSDFNSRVEMDLGVVSNVVVNETVVADSEFDNNTVLLHTVVYMDAAATVMSTHTVNFELDYGDVAPLTDSIVLTTDSPVVISDTDSTTLPTVDFSVVSMEDDSPGSHYVAKGQAVRFHMDIMVAKLTENDLTVKFLTPVNETGLMEICDVNVIKVGKNLPCHSKSMFNALYEERSLSTYTDIGTLELGHVCQFPLEDDEYEDVVRVEAVAKVTRVNSLAAGDKVWFSSSLRINDDQIFVSQVALVVVSDAEFNETTYNETEVDVVVNVTTSPTQVRPGEYYDFPVVLTVPSNCSVRGNLHVATPIDQTAVMTVHHVELTRAGANLACLNKRPDEDFNASYSSTQTTSQRDQGDYDLGFISNTGVTHRTNLYLPEDDQVLVTVTLQAADSIANVQGSTHDVDFVATMGSTDVTAVGTVEISRDNTEMPDLELDAEINSTITYGNADNRIVGIDCLLQHTTNSSAEGYNVTVSFFYPPYMQFVSIPEINFTQPEVTNTTGAHGVQIKFERLFFTDIVAFTVHLETTEASNLPAGLSEANATTPYEAGCNMIYRANHQDPPETFFVSRLDSLSFKILPPGVSGDCVDGPLGMESGKIDDCQISSSSSPVAGQEATSARYGGTSGWTPGVRRGEFLPYLQVNFGNRTKVTRVALEHPGMNSRVTSYQMLYSDDGIGWEDGETILPSASYTVSLDSLSFPVSSRYIRLVVTGKDGGQDVTSSVRAEFYGCRETGDRSYTDACASNSWDDYAPVAEFHNRGFLVAGSSMYFCDYVSQESGDMKCYTTDDGVTWETMDEGVVNIIGYYPDENELYGIARDKRSFISSDDGGATWKGVSHARVTQVSAEPTYQVAKDVPWLKNSKLQLDANDPDADYISGSWGANYQGMYRNSGSWAKVADWSVCCNIP